jgi:hypothetical protein
MNSLKLSPWYKWSVLSRGSGKHIVRRYRKAAGRIVWQTLPAKQYSHLSKEQLVNFVESLNKKAFTYYLINIILSQKQLNYNF